MVCIIKLICPQFRQSLTAHRVPRFSGPGDTKAQSKSIVVRTFSATDFGASRLRGLEPCGAVRTAEPPARAYRSEEQARDFASSCRPSRRWNRA